MDSLLRPPLTSSRELGPQVRRAALLVGSQETAHDLVHDAFVGGLLEAASGTWKADVWEVADAMAA